jgi:hypothetical protein
VCNTLLGERPKPRKHIVIIITIITIIIGVDQRWFEFAQDTAELETRTGHQSRSRDPLTPPRICRRRAIPDLSKFCNYTKTNANV